MFSENNPFIFRGYFDYIRLTQKIERSRQTGKSNLPKVIYAPCRFAAISLPYDIAVLLLLEPVYFGLLYRQGNYDILEEPLAVGAVR